jgi:Cu/Ag efflux protein CusF
MKRTLILTSIAVAAVAAPALWAAGGGMSGHGMQGGGSMMDQCEGMMSAMAGPGAASAAAQPHAAVGVVRAVDPAQGTVTIAHDPVESLKWPAMTMAFELRDRSAAAPLTPGARVAFVFVEERGRYVITAIK